MFLITLGTYAWAYKPVAPETLCLFGSSMLSLYGRTMRLGKRPDHWGAVDVYALKKSEVRAGAALRSQPCPER